MRRCTAGFGFIVLCFFIFVSSVQAGIIYVSTTGKDGNTGQSWQSAMRTVRTALAAARAGDEIWVAKGMYAEAITLKDKVCLYGGFDGEGDTRDWKRYQTVLQANTNTSVVTSPTGITEATVIDGFTIRNGKGSRIDNTAYTYGGGVFCRDSSPVISHNVITGNSCAIGAGIYCEGKSPTIADNVISYNTASSGAGGIACYWPGTPKILRNQVIDNTSGYACGFECFACTPTITGNFIARNNGSLGDGGGLLIRSCKDGVLSHNIIRDNISQGGGGGVYCMATSITVANNIISGNYCKWYGGGIRCYASSARVISNTIVGNTAYYGGGIFFNSPADPVVVNNIIAFNSSGLWNPPDAPSTPYTSNNCVYGNNGQDYRGILTPGDGDNWENPQFVSLDGGDYHLSKLSPCINRGLNSVLGLQALDIDGENRICSGIVDIGADEYQMIYVDIDIKPGDPKNHINLRSNAVIPVAVLSTPEFDAQTINVDTVTLAEAHPVGWGTKQGLVSYTEDVDMDGDVDLVFRFRVQDLQVSSNADGTTSVNMRGELSTGELIEGSDIVTVTVQKM